ncbi:MAG: glycoside hydrolase family 19 protein [Blastocatellales bacterium]
MITVEVLGSLLPALPVERRTQYAPHLQQAMDEFGINTVKRQAAFMAQISHESGGLKQFVENLNYSAQGLHRVFRKYFPTLESALPFHRKPEKIANRVYANRMSNGPESSGDGFRFRGRGAIQLTGRDNYTRFGRALGLDLVGNPDLAATPEIAFRTAGAFWKSRGCNELADSGNMREITRRINGGFIGLADRLAHYKHMLEVLSALPRSRGAIRGIERDVPRNLSRGIYPGRDLVESTDIKPAKKAAKKAVKPAAKKAVKKAVKLAAKKAVKKAAKPAAKKAVKKAAKPAAKKAVK